MFVASRWVGTGPLAGTARSHLPALFLPSEYTEKFLDGRLRIKKNPRELEPPGLALSAAAGREEERAAGVGDKIKGCQKHLGGILQNFLSAPRSLPAQPLRRSRPRGGCGAAFPAGQLDPTSGGRLGAAFCHGKKKQNPKNPDVCLIKLALIK